MWGLRTANFRLENGGSPMIQRFFRTLICLIAFAVAALVDSTAAIADEPSPTPSTSAPKVPADLAKRICDITDAVLEHHIDPPVRQQMIHGAIKWLHSKAGLPLPSGLSRRVSSVTTADQLAELLADVWPKATVKPTSKELEEAFEEALFAGLLECVAGGARLLSAKERKVAEQLEGNRYVGLHITLGRNEKENRPTIGQVIEGGPAYRAGIKPEDIIEEIDRADTEGMDTLDAIDRLRGEDGTVVTLKVRQPQSTTSRTIKVPRGRLPRSTVHGISKALDGGWDHRVDSSEPIAYLRIVELTASTPHELRKLASRLENERFRAILLDLRGLWGNSVHPAVLLADSLLEKGSIGRVRTAHGEINYQAEPDALFRGWPIVALVDANTSGTAEWLAAALQDNHRATIVGQATQGATRMFQGNGAITAPSMPITSKVSIGDGSWSIELATGSLERGDGRPLSAEPTITPFGERRFPIRPGKPDQIKTGVQPDHLTGPNRPVRARLPLQNQVQINVSEETLAKALELLRASLKQLKAEENKRLAADGQPK
jgi:carboxyl-terminal processing protease